MFNGFLKPFFSFRKNRYTIVDGLIVSCNELKDEKNKYIQSIEKISLDKQILTGMISKNQTKKMIRKNLRESYARN